VSEALLKRLEAAFPDEVIETHSRLGDDTAVVKRDRIVEIAEWLRDDPENSIEMMRDVTAVDYLDMGRAPRFDVVYHLYSLTKKHALRLRIPLEESDLHIQTLSAVWPAANWGERECWDMYGVRFDGHPDLRRLLLYEEFEGHPLRKDYDKRKSQPRCDLIAEERDAIAEHKRWEIEHGGKPNE
jgi:NADH-quinone oxidoreductase subunit C